MYVYTYMCIYEHIYIYMYVFTHTWRRGARGGGGGGYVLTLGFEEVVEGLRVAYCHEGFCVMRCHCNKLQHTATHCNTHTCNIGCRAMRCHCNTLQHTATHIAVICDVVWWDVTAGYIDTNMDIWVAYCHVGCCAMTCHYHTLQRAYLQHNVTVTQCNTLKYTAYHIPEVWDVVCISSLQRTAMHIPAAQYDCYTLQHTATHIPVMWGVVWWDVTATHCNTHTCSTMWL